MRRDRYDGEGLDMRFGLCGLPGVEVTDDPGLVRCRLCRKRMAPSAAPVAPVVVEAAPFVPSGPVPLEDVQGAHTIEPWEEAIIERSRPGDDTNGRPRWSSLDKAIAKTNQIKATSSSIRSSWKEEQLSGGSVRTLDGREDVLQVDLAIERAFTTPGTIGPAPMSPRELTSILVDVLRHGLEPSSIAHRLSEAHGYPITEKQVRQWIAFAKGRVREQLEAKGVIEKTKPRPSVESKEAPMAGDYEIEGWKQIAAVLNRSDIACRRYAMRETDPLPVVDQMGRVAAKRADLLAWLARQTKAYNAA